MQVPLQDAYAGVSQAETYEVLDSPVNEHILYSWAFLRLLPPPPPLATANAATGALSKAPSTAVAAPGLERACEVRRRELVELVKSYDHGPGRGRWWDYCKRHKRYSHNPAKQPAEFLERFLQEHASQRYCHIPAKQPAKLIANRSRFCM